MLFHTVIGQYGQLMRGALEFTSFHSISLWFFFCYLIDVIVTSFIHEFRSATVRISSLLIEFSIQTIADDGVVVVVLPFRSELKMSASHVMSSIEPLIPNTSNGLITSSNSQHQRRSPAIDSNLSVTLDDRGMYNVWLRSA